MSRGNWGYIVAAVGWLVICGAQQPAKQTGTTQGSQQTQTPAKPPSPPAKSTEPPYRPYPNRYADACYSAEHHDTADLCAQWRAAIAAEKAASEARIATIASIVGTVLSFATVVGLIVTIIQTNGALSEARRGNRLNLLFEKRSRREARKADIEQAKAIEIAERNAVAAYRAADVAEESLQISTRAWVTFSRHRIEAELNPNGTVNYIRVIPIFKNVGSTPARNYRVAVAHEFSDELGNFRDPPFIFGGSLTLGPGSEVYGESVKIQAYHIDEILHGRTQYRIYVHAVYMTVFDDIERVTRYTGRAEIRGNVVNGIQDILLRDVPGQPSEMT